jgi:sensor histidine kinase regulating citrate/malate metabolism
MRTPEQVLREIVADNVFRIAQLISENDKLIEQVKEKDEEIKRLTENSQKLIDMTLEKIKEE